MKVGEEGRRKKKEQEGRRKKEGKEGRRKKEGEEGDWISGIEVSHLTFY